MDSCYLDRRADVVFARFQLIEPLLVWNEHWLACKTLVADVRAAGGTWTAYRRQTRKDVLLLRSLVLRGRTKDASDPVVARVFQLPNDVFCHVLKFWRATCDATGEVI